MVTPLMNITRSRGDNRRNRNNAKFTPVGMTIVSPMDSVSPINTRMTPIRKSLFQRRLITSNKRRKDSFIPHVDDSRDDFSEIESLKSANKKKDGHIKVLHERFTHIQNGLGSIDEERNQLIEKEKRLDKEKKVIQKQLELREREILTLIKRCASQEEKMRESSKLRATNRDLHKHLDLMANKLRVIEEETQDRENLKKLLQDSELEREQLRDRLAKVQREHDAITDTLQECLGNIRQLAEEKYAIEEERRRERKRAEIELEKQHIAHVNDSNTLKQNIQEHQSRILQMENILQDNIKSNTDLRREKALMSQGQHEEIQEVIEKYERQLQELRDGIEETLDSGNQHDKCQNVEDMNLMKEKLKSKDEQIRELEKEFSDQMVKLMSSQHNLNEVEEERRDLELKVESAEKLEIEHAALLDFVEILDSNLAELTTTNAHLELEKDNLREETEELRKKANILQRQCSTLQSNQKAKQSDFRELLNAENNEIRTELQGSLQKSQSEIISLQAELENRNQRISQLENDLIQARKLIADKENEIDRIVKQMKSLRSNLEADLRRARLQAAQYEEDISAKNQTLASLEGTIGKTSNIDGELKDRIRNLEKELFQAKVSRSESIASLGEAQERIEKLEIQLDGDDKRTVSLEHQLQKVTNDLLKEKSKAYNLENEYYSTTVLQSERKSYTEEARSSISILEEKIEEMKKESNGLDLRMREYRRENTDKDNIISSLKVDLVESQEDTKELRSEIQMKCIKMENLELSFSKKNEEFEMQIECTNISLKKKGDRILELEKLVSTNDDNVKSLQDSLSMAKDEIAQLEDRISCEKNARMVLEEKLREVDSNNVASASVNEQRIIEVEEALREKIEEVAKKNKIILKTERQCKILEEKVQSLYGQLKGENEHFVKLKKELKLRNTEIKEQQQTIKILNISTLSLQEAAEKANNEVLCKNDVVVSLTKSVDDLKLDLENAKSNIASNDDRVQNLENRLKAEKESRLKLEGEIAVTRECVSESQKVKENLTKELEEKKEGESTAEKNLSEARNALEALNHSSSEHISRLESQISKMTADMARKDIEIRDLRFEGLASKKNVEHAPQKESLISQIEALKSELQTLSLENTSYDKHHDEETNLLRKEIKSLQSSKLELECKRDQFVEGISQRDTAIEKLKDSLLKSELCETEIIKQRRVFQKSELEVRDQMEEMKAEYEQAAARENELMNIKLSNKDSLHKEELKILQSELESTLKKLQDSERLLAERGHRPSEMVDNNREIKSELEKEERKLRINEDKFFQEQNILNTTKVDLAKVQVEPRRKESVRLSKLKEERNEKEFAEESLRIAKNKNREAMKTRRNVNELERENGELKDKIRRQEAYLQRKLQKEKMDRSRLTPSKSSVSPSIGVPRTPSRRTPTQKTTKIPRKELSQSSTCSRLRLQAPSTDGQAISTSIPSNRKNRPKTSPTAASVRSARTTRSVFSRSTLKSTLSAQDILQSELDDDRSLTSELSSITRSPNAKASSVANKVPDWELEPRE